jgi:hypothetical protein
METIKRWFLARQIEAVLMWRLVLEALGLRR